MALKAAGPAMLGNRWVPSGLESVRPRLVPALFAALLVTQVFGGAQGISVDARLGGLAAALLGATLRAPPLLIILAAVAFTASLR